MKPTLYTYDEATAAIGELKNHHEIWDGRLIMEPAAPRLGHQDILYRLFRPLSDHVIRHRLGKAFISPLDMVLTPKLCLQPDAAFLLAENLGQAGRKITGPADWVAEVTYPEGRRRDAVKKLARYEAHGVREYWLVDVEAQLIQVFGFPAGGSRYILLGAYPSGRIARSRVIEGFKLRVSDLFRMDAGFEN
jgi:Uma2 family endonuclease